MSGDQPKAANSELAASTSVDASSSAAIAIEEEGVKMTTRSDGEASSTTEPGDGGLSVGAATAVEVEAATTVSYSADGFSPQQLTVPLGTTVHFKNASGGQMWVAATESSTCEEGQVDIFNQCAAGETFSYTFAEAGEYNYLNQHNNTHTGTVIVTAE